jgi:hypothetical protein
MVEETLCPHCDRETRTIMGGCPECGYGKEPVRNLEPRRAARSPWRYDMPGYDLDTYGFQTAVAMALVAVGAVSALLYFLSWPFAAGGLALLVLWWWILS